MEPIVTSNKDVEIYRRYVSFGFRDRQVLSKPGLDIHGSAVLGSKLKHFVHDKVLDHETRFMPLLVAVCSFVEEEEQHLLNFYNINRPLTFSVLPIHRNKTKLKYIFHELNISKLFYKEDKTHNLVEIKNTVEFKKHLSRFGEGVFEEQ